jgi:hypothetical protein
MTSGVFFFFFLPVCASRDFSSRTFSLEQRKTMMRGYSRNDHYHSWRFQEQGVHPLNTGSKKGLAAQQGCISILMGRRRCREDIGITKQTKSSKVTSILFSLYFLVRRKQYHIVRFPSSEANCLAFPSCHLQGGCIDRIGNG